MNIKEIKAMAPATEPARQKYFMEHVKARIAELSPKHITKEGANNEEISKKQMSDRLPMRISCACLHLLFDFTAFP